MPLLDPGFNRIVLASRSPRRIELLKKILPDFEVIASNIDETQNGVNNPAELVQRISRRKAEKVAQQVRDGIIIGADSIVVLNGKTLGKPGSPQDSFHTLMQLSGKTHQVFTGFTIIKNPEYTVISDYEVTTVKFRPLDPREIDAYIQSGQPRDKAGSYGIQDDAAVFVESITGCYYNVVGLPITKLFLALKNLLAGPNTPASDKS